MRKLDGCCLTRLILISVQLKVYGILELTLKATILVKSRLVNSRLVNVSSWP
jgi:hypothetical protein